jgi:hypothetical protein
MLLLFMPALSYNTCDNTQLKVFKSKGFLFLQSFLGYGRKLTPEGLGTPFATDNTLISGNAKGNFLSPLPFF